MTCVISAMALRRRWASQRGRAGLAAVLICLGVLTASPTSAQVGAPVLTTTASPGGPVGTPLTDTATLAGGSPGAPAPTGLITFNLFGPDNPSCAGAPIFTSVVPVLGFGNYTTPVPFVPTVPGTYRWVASHSGDPNYLPVATACNDPAETVVVTGYPLAVSASEPGTEAAAPAASVVAAERTEALLGMMALVAGAVLVQVGVVGMARRRRRVAGS